MLSPETFSSDKRHGERTIAEAENQTADEDVLLTEGRTVLVSETAVSRKFNISSDSVCRISRVCPAQHECHKSRNEPAGNCYRLPDQSRRQYQMGGCPKRGQ